MPPEDPDVIVLSIIRRTGAGRSPERDLVIICCHNIAFVQPAAFTGCCEI